MLAVARGLAFAAGIAVVLMTLASAIKTVVMPRSEAALLSRWVFVTLRKLFDAAVRRASTWQKADRIMARFAPVGLLLLPVV